jgi:hypothetical protein
MIIGLNPIFSQIKISNKPDGFYATNEATTTVANEYLPIWVKTIPDHRSYNPVELYSGNATVINQINGSQKITARINVLAESIIRINKIYYPGWGVTLNDIPTKINYQNDEGLMLVSVKPGDYLLKAEFRETISRFLADCVSLIGFVIYILYLIHPVVRVTKSDN